MWAGNYEIQFCQHIVRVIKGAIHHDVHLAASEYGNAVCIDLGDGANLSNVSTQPFDGKPIGLRLRTAVVSQNNGVESARKGLIHHASNGKCSIACSGVAMEFGLDVLDINQVLGRLVLKFAVILTQLWRNPPETQRLINGFFGAGCNGLFAALLRGSLGGGIFFEQSVFVQAKSHLLGTLAEPHVVFLTSSEVQQRGAVLRVRHGAKVDLHSVCGTNTRLCFTGNKHLRNTWRVAECLVECCRLSRACNDINVADGFLATSQAASVGDACDSAGVPEIGDQFQRHGQGFAKSDPTAGGVKERE